MKLKENRFENICCIVAALLFLSLVFLTEIIYHLALVMRTNKENLETVCCIIAAAIFLAPAVWIVARELMGY